MSARILFVEDEDALRGVLLEAARSVGYEAQAVASAEDALVLLAREVFGIVVTDVRLPQMSGLDLLPELARSWPHLIAIVITGHGTIDTAVEAMKRGAADFLTKPLELATLLGVLRVATERATRGAPSTETSINKSTGAARGIVAGSAQMRNLLAQVAAIAQYNTTVLVTGETGTGKELVARSIHQQSPRARHPLVALNCAAVPEQLLEDELFGHVKGAFTGAQAERKGRFEQADGGTLFLDEIGDMSLSLQSKLLRVLQEREFERLGSSRTVKVDVRVVAATSADLERRIADGSFRPDLFYRLNVMHLRVPPLRERPDDLRPLAVQLLKRFCDEVGLPAKSIDAEAWRALLPYRWPGNVRQLQNAMERAAALSGATPVIRLEDLPEEVRGGAASGVTPVLARDALSLPAPGQQIPEEGLNFDAAVMNVERDLLLQALQLAGGNKSRAANLLNLRRTTFLEKLKRLQIEPEAGAGGGASDDLITGDG